MKIVFLDAKTLGKVDLSKLEELGELIIFQTTPNKTLTIERIKDADIVITNKVIIDKEVMDRAKKLKLIQVAATGMNNIDLDEAKKRGIVVKNVIGYSTSSVVEHTFGMIFYLVKKLRYFDDYTRSNYFNSDIFTHIKDFFELYQKRIGIIGLGTIGKEVAKVAKAFGMEVVYFSTTGKNFNGEFKRVELEELLSTSKVISIHAPLNENTKNLLDYKRLKLIKDGAILLNLGRGGIINESDLLKVLKEGKKIFVGLDVLENEPPKDSKVIKELVKFENVFITPHIAWASIEARDRLVDGMYKNIKEFIG